MRWRNRDKLKDGPLHGVWVAESGRRERDVGASPDQVEIMSTKTLGFLSLAHRTLEVSAIKRKKYEWVHDGER